MRKRCLLLMLVLGVLLVLSVAVGTAMGSPGILYVKPGASGTGDCSSWANACTLQHALEDVASYGDEIWVMADVYTPTTTGTDRTASFQLVSGVEVYGGFVGTETSRDQRDWESNVTVLSGDIDDNDITDPDGVITTTENISGSNSYHVVTSSSVSETCVFDGFTVTGGSATGTDSATAGGGGMDNDAASPTLTSVSFSGNQASGYGGGMRNSNSSSPTLTNVTFSGNDAYSGGGMYTYGSDGSPTLTEVTFSGNSASNGGAMANVYSKPMLAKVTFYDNEASQEGGGMYNRFTSSGPTLVNVTFNGNSAQQSGGGIMNRNGSSPTLTNVTFSGNDASSGGAMANEFDNSSPTLTNVTFSGNSAAYSGGAVRNSWGSPTLRNTVLWGNTSSLGAQIYNYGGSTPTISYSLVQGSGGSGPGWDTGLGTDGGDNIDIDPQFVDADGPDDIVGTLDDNLRLGDISSGIDAGDNSAVPADTLDLDADGDKAETVPFDLDGCPRILLGTVDLGAYEWPTCLTLTKTVLNDDGGTAVAGDFQAYIDGTPVPWGIAQPVISGTHTVSETVLPGYSASAWSGDCATDGTITLTLDDRATCSITNDDVAPTVTLTKTVINDDDGAATVSDFQAYLDGAPVPWGVPQSVAPGAYTVSESELLGYEATAWGGDCNKDGTITLSFGEDAVCSITNDDTLHSYVPLVLKRYQG